MALSIDEIIKIRYADIMKRRERLLEAWLAETGLLPSESVLMQHQKDGTMNIWVRAKTDAERILDREASE